MAITPEFLRIHLGKTLDQLGTAERRVLERASSQRTVTTDVNAAFSAEAGPGERLADAIARVGGSWGFIIFFGAFLAVWVAINSYVLLSRAFDPYPFVFLNLILSMLAAIQAPVIMMSQNRQAARDRFEAAKDYEVNLKAELEVLSLHRKIDLQVLAEIAAVRNDLAGLKALIEQKD